MCNRSALPGQNYSILRAFVLVGIFIVGLQGCSSFISGATKNLANQLQATISNHDDPELVKQAVPAYMLMLDSFLRSDSENVDLLIAASGLYTAYSSVFVEEPDRQKRLADRGFDYAQQAVCVYDEDFCGLKQQPYDDYQRLLAELEDDDVPVMFSYGSAWGNWLKANSSDFNAIADLPKVTRLMEKLVQLEPGYQQGGGHLYLGIIHTLTPPAVGGKPDVAKQHFEQALTYSAGKNLMVKVTFAQQYARMMFDQDLHDRLLNEVIAADPVVPDLTLTNRLAVEQAKRLLRSGVDYF